MDLDACLNAVKKAKVREWPSFSLCCRVFLEAFQVHFMDASSEAKARQQCFLKDDLVASSEAQKPSAVFVSGVNIKTRFCCFSFFSEEEKEPIHLCPSFSLPLRLADWADFDAWPWRSATLPEVFKRAEERSHPPLWVWVKMPPGMLPLTRVSFWVPIFDPQPDDTEYTRKKHEDMGGEGGWPHPIRTL